MCSKQTPSLRQRFKGLIMRRVRGMITCREFEDFVPASLDNELIGKQTTHFKRHFRLCRECRQYLAAYQRSMEISQAVLKKPTDSRADDVPEELIATILDSKISSANE